MSIEKGLLPNRGVCLDSFRGLPSSSPPRGTLLDRALRPRVKCLGLFLRCPFVEKSCERLSDLQPRAGQHSGEPNWRRSRPLARWLRSSSHDTMAKSSRSSLEHAGFALFSTLGKMLLQEKGEKREKRQTVFQAAQVALLGRRPAPPHVLLGRHHHLGRPSGPNKGRAVRSEQHPQNDTFPWCSASDKSSCSGSFV